jgi:hypothetical protein
MAESESISFEAELKLALNQEPFQPFSISLTSGDRYQISDPGSVSIGTSTVIHTHPRRGRSFFRKSQIVAVDVPEEGIIK